MNEFNKDMRRADTIMYAAIKTIRPDDIFWIDGGELKFKDDSRVPTDVEIESAIEAESIRHISNNYARDRAVHYPNIGDQLDALFHAGVFPAEMAAEIQAIKDTYPKP